jgi:O-antigen ligase
MAVLDKEKARQIAQTVAMTREPMAGVFFWLSAFYVVYCARPEDWIPGLAYIPLAKITGIFALLGLLLSAGRSKRGFRDLPKEAMYLAGIIGLLFGAAVLSTVWRGGAFFHTIDFSKVLVAWVLTFFVVTSFDRLRRIIFIQSASVGLIAVVSIIKGRSHPRLEGVIGGIYSNPNDLAFAIVLSLPFCFAFILRTRNMVAKLAWGVAMLAMCAALFLTASRAGFIDLVVTGAICLWIFGIKGRRPQLVAGAAVVALIVGFAAGGRLKDRFLAIQGGRYIEDSVDESAYGSYEERRYLMVKSLDGIVHYPWGIGLGNFTVYSGKWREVHMSYLQIAVEGGLGSFVLYLMFFGRGFTNLKRLRQERGVDPEMDLFVGALFATLVGFVVGALFAPEAYQYFPYFAVAYTSVMVAIVNERQPGEAPQSPKSSLRSRPWLREPAPAGELATVGGNGRGDTSRNLASRDFRNQR